MINDQELIFVVDTDNKPVSPVARDVAHKEGLWHRSCDIWVINSKGEILCQKRSMKKDVKPGKWEAFFGGHLLAGEEYLDSAVKETGEELGIAALPGEFEFFKVYKSDEDSGRGYPHRQFKYIFRLKRDGDAGDFKYEEDEIDELKWMPFFEVRKIIVEEKDPNWSLPGYAQEVFDWLQNE